MRTVQTPGFKQFSAPQAIRADGTALLCKEVLYSVSSGNKKAAICSGFVFLKEPSDGLEPSTPSLPWRIGTAVASSQRHLIERFPLQLGWFLRRPPSP
jgi:hypothetical protein